MKRKGYLAGLLLAWVLLGAGCKNGEAAPELYLDKGDSGNTGGNFHPE